MAQWPSDSEFLNRIEQGQEQGKTIRQMADEMGVSFKSLDTHIYKVRRQKKLGYSPAPKTAYAAGDNSSDTEEKLTMTSNGGAMDVESQSKRIKTLDDLVEACQINLDEWLVERWTANKWEVGIKVPDGDGGYFVTVEPLFQVKANLLPRHPKFIELPVEPVTIAVPVPRAPTYTGTSGRGLVLPDMQTGYRRDVQSGRLTPFHDRRALDIALQIAQDQKFDRLSVIGDILDMTDWTDKFVREPGFYWTTQPALYEAHWWLSQFCLAQPDADRDALEGNHDLRPQTAIATHLLAAYGLTAARKSVHIPALSVENLLGLDELGIAWLSGYPNNQSWMGPVRLIHGDIARNGPADTVKALSTSAQETVIQGHIHRIEWASRTIERRGGTRVVAAFSPGCLCRIDYVVPGHKRGQQWQQGCAVVEWNGDDYGITPIVIQDGRAVYNGKVYKARDRVADLNRDTADVRDGWKF